MQGPHAAVPMQAEGHAEFLAAERDLALKCGSNEPLEADRNLNEKMEAATVDQEEDEG